MILAIDPGTSCGWAIQSTTNQPDMAGTWDLKPKRHEGGGMRYLRLRGYLLEIQQSQPVTMVVYEEVRRHAGTSAAHVYGGIVSTLTMCFEESGIPYVAVPVGTWKKGTVGKGNANKDLILDYANAKWSHLNIGKKQYDAADAACMAHWAATEYPHVLKLNKVQS
jgi:Holliday junction resolvasome RuvABC endonuclease subunit